MNMNLMLAMTLTTSAAMGVMTLLLIPKSTTIWLEWKMMETEFNSMNFALMVDWKSAIFAWTVTLIASSIISYSKFYMPNQSKTSFIKVILSFVASMVLLIISPTMISVMLGWEGLGMSSFILIMHFINKSSLMSSLYTMLMNRVGDIMLMMSMILMMNLTSWTLTACSLQPMKLLMVALTIGLFSKSAQVPFSSWLTEAMAAPTPVSALVHSSTLVTAGVYIMIRMELSMSVSSMNYPVIMVATATLLMASLNATLELDIKVETIPWT